MTKIQIEIYHMQAKEKKKEKKILVVDDDDGDDNELKTGAQH